MYIGNNKQFPICFMWPGKPWWFWAVLVFTDPGANDLCVSPAIWQVDGGCNLQANLFSLSFHPPALACLFYNGHTFKRNATKCLKLKVSTSILVIVLKLKKKSSFHLYVSLESTTIFFTIGRWKKYSLTTLLKIDRWRLVGDKLRPDRHIFWRPVFAWKSLKDNWLFFMGLWILKRDKDQNWQSIPKK